MNDQNLDILKKEIDRHYNWFNTGSRLWSTMHHGSLYLAAILSGSSALVLKLESLEDLAFRADVAAILSAIAALLGTLAAAGGFQRKWQANRVDRGNLDQLRIELSNPEADLMVIRNKLKEIVERHDKAITGQQ